jgi:hypothetical protein
VTSEAIARVVADIRDQRVVPFPGAERAHEHLGISAASYVKHFPTIDATVVYRTFTDSDKNYDIYAESIVRPVHDAYTTAYLNEHGNVIVMHAITAPRVDGAWDDLAWQPINAEHTIDWDEIEWCTAVGWWLGGRTGDGQAIHTLGPVYLIKLAIKADGTMQDLSWVDFTQGRYPPSNWDTAVVVWLKTATWLNCRNVELLEPRWSRPTRRRLDRMGVHPRELHIWPIGKTRQMLGPRRLGDGTSPLTTVRGHVARYGVEGRGLLFGKYAGTFWIPAHIRGSEVNGVSNPLRVVHSQDQEGHGDAADGPEQQRHRVRAQLLEQRHHHADEADDRGDEQEDLSARGVARRDVGEQSNHRPS